MVYDDEAPIPYTLVPAPEQPDTLTVIAVLRALMAQQDAELSFLHAEREMLRGMLEQAQLDAARKTL